MTDLFAFCPTAPDWRVPWDEMDREYPFVRALAGWKGYTTNLVGQRVVRDRCVSPVVAHREGAFRMSKHDLHARPIYHRARDSIEAPPQCGVRRDGGLILDRAPNGLENQEICPHPAPLPHRHHPSR